MSSIRRGGTSGATWTCRSYAPRTSCRARSDGRVSTPAPVAIARATLAPAFGGFRGEVGEHRRARARDARLHAELLEQLRRGLHLVKTPRRVTAAALEQPLQEWAADHRCDLVLEPGLATFLASGLMALEHCRRQALHQD